MVNLNKLVLTFYNYFLSEEIKEKSEKFIVYIAIASFLMHLLLIGLVNQNIITIGNFLGLVRASSSCPLSQSI